MQVVLLVVQILIALAMIGVILIQRTAQDGGGLTGGSTTMGGLFTARGSANLLTHVTAVLAFLFIVNSLALGVIASREHGVTQGSLLDQAEPTIPPAPGAPNPAPADVPPAPKASDPSAPPATSTPVAPAVPMGQ